MTTPPSVPPGWYPDPEGGASLRWHNGTQWTDQRQAHVQQQFAAPPPADTGGRITIHYGFALLAVLSLIGTLVFGIPMLSTASDPDTHGIGAGLGALWMIWGLGWTLVWTAFAINHTLKSRRR